MPLIYDSPTAYDTPFYTYDGTLISVSVGYPLLSLTGTIGGPSGSPANVPQRVRILAGTGLKIDFNTTFSSRWSEEAKQGTDVLSADVTSARYVLKGRLSTADANAKVEKTLGDGIVSTDGTLTVTLDPEDTADLQGTYFMTLRLFLQDGAVADWQDANYADMPYVQVDIAQGAVEAVS